MTTKPSGEFPYQGDSFQVVVKARGDAVLHRAVDMAMMDYSGAAAWREFDGALEFYWFIPDGTHPFPAKLTPSECADMAVAWLRTRPPPPGKPDTDGSVSVGFDLWTSRLSGTKPYLIFSVVPAWMIFGK